MKLWIKMPRDDRGHFHLRSRVAFGAYRSRYAPEWYASDSVAFWSGESDVPVERTFRRRSAAKRWLLARAAGLAEVPRARRPRGWRWFGLTQERNRRRR